jgi:hypothetical protein
VEVAKIARARVLRSSDRFWHPSDLPGAQSTVQHLLTELTKEGELRRVRRGAYWRGTRTPLGMSPPPTDGLISELVGKHKGSGPTGLSAASLLRLSTQVPRRAHVAVPGRAPTSTSTVRFVSRSASPGRRDAALSPIEVALLEMLADFSASELSPRESWDRLRVVLDSHEVRPKRLATASATEPATTRARLAALMTETGHHDLASRIPPADPRVTARALKLTA